MTSRGNRRRRLSGNELSTADEVWCPRRIAAVALFALDSSEGRSAGLGRRSQRIESDFVLNLGVMLANGGKQYPRALVLIVTDETGKSRQFELYLTEAAVLGDECLLGVIPLEAMDLVVNAKLERVTPNPAHPDGPVFRA